MFISHTPINLPVSTANVAVESLIKEASVKPQIPESPPATQSSNSKQATDFSSQNKPDLLNSLIQDKTIKEQAEKNEEQNKDSADNSEESKGLDEANSQSAENVDLDREEQLEVAQLQARDREVRAHEAAHASVGGSLAGSPNLSFTSGPDGKRYATSGDVSIDISKVANDPSATITKLQQVQRAALAPAQPSSQDRKVAAIASAGISQAQAKLRLDNQESSKEQVQIKGASESAKENSLTDGFNSIKEQNNFINPIKALRESRALEQKIEDSGALNAQSFENALSLIA